MTQSLVAQWEQKLGVKSSDPNFETFVRDELSNEDEATEKSTLILLGFEKPPVQRVKFDGSFVPDWLEREK